MCQCSAARMLKAACLALLVVIAGGCAKQTAVPSGPNPGTNATNVNCNVELTWNETKGAKSYDVYFGAEQDPPKVAEGVTKDEKQEKPTYILASTLEAGKTYYWKIVARNEQAGTPGPVWSFTTTTRRYASVAAGGWHNLALTSDGSIISWGAASAPRSAKGTPRRRPAGGTVWRCGRTARLSPGARTAADSWTAYRRARLEAEH